MKAPALLFCPATFVAHAGDIKSGSSPCTDEILLREEERLGDPTTPYFTSPVTARRRPGDNERTDRGPTSYDPIERLERLPEIFFVGDASLGDETIPLTRQGADYPENARWSYI